MTAGKVVLALILALATLTGCATGPKAYELREKLACPHDGSLTMTIDICHGAYSPDLYRIWCTDCGATQGWREDADAAIDAWNRRASE